MNPDFRKVALIAATLGLLVSLYVALSRDSEQPAPPATTEAATTAPAETTAAPTTQARPAPEFVDVDASSGEIVRATVERGSRVVLNVRADVADHVHVHGYDLMADVAPGKVAKLSFRATITGRFEVELEDRGALIAELTVEP